MLHCPYCKGGHQGDDCPFYLKARALMTIKKSIVHENFQSNSPAPFVGRFGYPDIHIGILTPPETKEDTWLYDAPKYWAAQAFQIPQIVTFRTSLVNSQEVVNIKDTCKVVELGQLIAMADKPVELDIALKKKPSFNIQLDAYHAPTGPRAQLKRADITANPSIPTKVDKVFSDVDLKAHDALTYLYHHDFDENFLSRLLSVGTVGIRTNRKLVPTRWSITATDDLLGKHLLEKVRDYPVADISACIGTYLGNTYLILFFPEPWSYELFEIYLPSYQKTCVLDYSTDFESFDGRKNYAEDCAGGYYTVRLAILEKLSKIKRQASVLAIRVITDDYTVPLGVWVTREATRKALENKGINFSDDKLALMYARALMKKRFGIDITQMLKESKLLALMKTQKKLTSFT